jgi:hypothetical protein
MNTKRTLLIAVVIVAGLLAYSQMPALERSWAPADTDQALADAFETRTSDLQVEGQGTVVKLLPDDDEDRRHQRFILQLASGQTLLIAHNIDLAPRVTSLEHGDTVAFFGEYEWNEKGGLIHWTHHDPKGLHVAGWLKHKGHTYQ